MTTVEFRTSPEAYRHWRLSVDGPVATLRDGRRRGGRPRPGYELKLNSYDLGVDIELYDAVQRLRFEHPEVRTVVLTSAKEKVFCAGANIRMLAASLARVEGELLQVHQRDPQRHGGRDARTPDRRTWPRSTAPPPAAGTSWRWPASTSCWSTTAPRAVSLPELPLLGVLPGTGGLTRVVDKRHVRRDLADYFATRSEGVGGRKAVQWGLVDEAVPRARWDETVADRAAELAARSDRPSGPRDRADPAGQDPRPTTRSPTGT